MNEAMVKSVLTEFNIYDSSQTNIYDNWLVTTCPFAKYYHKNGTDRNPSFGICIVEDAYSYFRCFSCKQRGLLYLLPDKLARAKGKYGGDPAGVLFVLDAEQEAFKQMGLQPPKIMDYSQKQKPEPVNEYIYSNLFETLEGQPKGLNYLNSRGISLETAQQLNILFDPDEMRVVFPIKDMEGELYGYTGRTIREDWERFNKPPLRRYPRIKNYGGLKKEWFLLGENFIQAGKPIFVVEGLFGYASLVEKGISQYGSVVACMGSDLSKAQAQTLLKTRSSVYVLFDNDEAGENGLFGTGSSPGAVGLLYNYCPLYVPEWPKGKTDPDELTLKDIENILINTCAYRS